MSDLISRQAAIDELVKAIREDPYYDSNEAINGLGVCDVRVIINDLPAAQPERKKGKWINGYCSNCREHAPYYPMASTYYESKFCPNCGADMRGEQECTKTM